MSHSKPICVIGSNSFSGAAFCSHMLKQGREIIAISRSVEPIDALLPYKLNSTVPELKQLQFHQFDLNHHLNQIEQQLDQHKISQIYNFAAQSMVGQSWQRPEHWFMTNAVSTIKFHNRLKNKDYLDKYIHISTPEVYGNCEGLVTENRNYHPSTPYAVSRAAADMSLHSFNDAYDFPVVFTRAANVYGEGQQLYRIIPRTIMYILQNKTLQLHGGGISRRSFIHIDDVATATQAIAEHGTNGEIYHISTTEMITIKDLIMKICQMMDHSFEALCEVSEDRLGKDSAYWLDATKLKTSLSWQDNISLEQGLERTIAWVKNNFDSLALQPSDYIHKA
jgi:dTDP-glucose 4,6-dehydratase